MDIESLFTNLPLDETIEICCRELYKNTNSVAGLHKKEFRKLMEFATKEMLFVFNGSYYQQIEGVAMGSPLGPILANIFLCYHEKEWLKNCPEEFRPMKYVRYVDDTFLLFWDESHIDMFQQYLNQQHTNIKFTVEKEENGHLPFLDINITKTDTEFLTGMYRKPTFSGVYSNYRSLIPPEYKFGLVTTLLYRSFELVSDYVTLDKEIKNLKEILKKNHYPDGFIDKVIYKFLNHKFTPKTPVATVPKRKVRVVLPFLGQTSLNIKKKLRELFRMVPSYQVEVIFTTSYRLGNMFRFKDLLPESIMTDFVYFFKCSCCAATYVGRCYRHRQVRFCEHAGLSPLTGKAYKQTLVNASSIKEHMIKENHPVDHLNDFKILSRGGTREILDIKESIMIGRLNPTLNEKDSSAPLFLYE